MRFTFEQSRFTYAHYICTLHIFLPYMTVKEVSHYRKYQHLRYFFQKVVSINRTSVQKMYVFYEHMFYTHLCKKKVLLYDSVSSSSFNTLTSCHHNAPLKTFSIVFFILFSIYFFIFTYIAGSFMLNSTSQLQQVPVVVFFFEK